MPINDGGQAFPVAIYSLHVKGMTLRDYFAGQALAGLLGSTLRMNLIATESDKIHLPRDEGLALACYAIANAMITERKRDAPPR